MTHEYFEDYEDLAESFELPPNKVRFSPTYGYRTLPLKSNSLKHHLEHQEKSKRLRELITRAENHQPLFED